MGIRPGHWATAEAKNCSKQRQHTLLAYEPEAKNTSDKREIGNENLGETRSNKADRDLNGKNKTRTERNKADNPSEGSEDLNENRCGQDPILSAVVGTEQRSNETKTHRKK
jgi:hypothetical protein